MDKYKERNRRLREARVETWTLRELLHEFTRRPAWVRAEIKVAARIQNKLRQK